MALTQRGWAWEAGGEGGMKGEGASPWLSYLRPGRWKQSSVMLLLTLVVFAVLLPSLSFSLWSNISLLSTHALSLSRSLSVSLSRSRTEWVTHTHTREITNSLFAFGGLIEHKSGHMDTNTLIWFHCNREGSKLITKKYLVSLKS